MQVDPGSDDEQELFAGLPVTAAAAAAAEQQERQQPWLALSKGFRQRRITLNDDKSQYDDAAAAAVSGGGHGSPRFDLHSVADSMRLVRTSFCSNTPRPNSNLSGSLVLRLLCLPQTLDLAALESMHNRSCKDMPLGCVIQQQQRQLVLYS